MSQVAAEQMHWDGEVPLSQVLAHVLPAYGGDTWAEALAWLHATPSEARVIADLAASGPNGFTEPVRVDLPDPDDLDEDEDDTPRIGNGMHRIATAVLLGHTHIRCTTRVPNERADAEYIEVLYELPSWPDPDTGDAMDYACDWLRSFPLPDGTWVETDLIAGRGDVLEGLWTCPHRLHDDLIAELRRRAPAIKIAKTRLRTVADLDAEYAALGIA